MVFCKDGDIKASSVAPEGLTSELTEFWCCLSYSLIAMAKHHSQGNLEKKAFSWGYSFKGSMTVEQRDGSRSSGELTLIHKQETHTEHTGNNSSSHLKPQSPPPVIYLL